MDNRNLFSKIFQITFGTGIIAAGLVLLYQNICVGTPERLSLRSAGESLRAVEDAYKVQQEQSVKLEKLLRLQLFQSKVAAENWRSFRECASAIAQHHSAYAAEQQAAAESAEAELSRLKALKKICAGTDLFPGYVTALKNTAAAVDPLRRTLNSGAGWQNYKGTGKYIVNHIGTFFNELSGPVNNVHNALSGASVSLGNISIVCSREFLPAIDRAIAALEKEIRQRKEAAAKAIAQVAEVNKLCITADWQNNIGSLNTAAEELQTFLNNLHPNTPGSAKLTTAELRKRMDQLNQEIAQAEKNKAEFLKSAPALSAESYDRILTDLRHKLEDTRKLLSGNTLHNEAREAISKAASRFSKLETIKKQMTLSATCELLLWLFAGAGFIANALKNNG